MRVLFEMSSGKTLMQCPCCFEDRTARVNCWCCEGNRWHEAREWQWERGVVGMVQWWGGQDDGAEVLERLRGVTVDVPAWFDAETGERKPGAQPPHEDCVCHDEATPCPACGRIHPCVPGVCMICREAGVVAPDPYGLAAKWDLPERLRATMERQGCATLTELLDKVDATMPAVETPAAAPALVDFSTWICCPLCQRDTRHVGCAPSKRGAQAARCAVCGLAHEVAP